jgi:hypothetical protein
MDRPFLLVRHTHTERRKKMYVGAVIGIDRAAASALILQFQQRNDINNKKRAAFFFFKF